MQPGSAGSHLAQNSASLHQDGLLRHWICQWLRKTRYPSQQTGQAIRVTYISTTGVYGDTAGAWINESRPMAPGTPRARLRQAAERVLRRSVRNAAARTRASGVASFSMRVLRAPGIYAAERLPLARLLNKTPLPPSTPALYSNHIHADDLARGCLVALLHGANGRTWNVVDDQPLTIHDWYAALASWSGLQAPAEQPMATLAGTQSAMALSFLQESRRLRNDRMRKELRLKLIYPTVHTLLSALPAPRILHPAGATGPITASL